MLPLVPIKNILVITNETQAPEVRKQLPKLPKQNVISEPTGRDTCAAVTLGAAIVGARSTTARSGQRPRAPKPGSAGRETASGSEGRTRCICGAATRAAAPEPGGWRRHGRAQGLRVREVVHADHHVGVATKRREPGDLLRTHDLVRDENVVYPGGHEDFRLSELCAGDANAKSG